MELQKTVLRLMVFPFFLLFACSVSNSGEPASAPNNSTRTVKVAVFDNYPPAQWRDESGSLTGYAVDLIEAVASKMGWHLELIPSTFDVILPGIQSKRFDVGVSSFGVNRDRLKIVDMVPISTGGNVVGMLKASGLTADKATDLCAHSVGMIRGSVEGPLLEALSTEHCTSHNFLPVKLLTFPDSGAVLAALESGRVDFMANGSDQMKGLVSKRADLTMGALKYSSTWSSWAVRKGDELGLQLADAINSLIDDGTYGAVFTKWNASQLKRTYVINSDSPDGSLHP